MGAFACAVLPRGRRCWSLLAVPALALSPPFIHLHTFATLIAAPAIALSFVLIARTGPHGRTLGLLLLVAPSVMIHGALAYLLLCMAILMEAPRPEARQILRIGLAFGASFAVGVLAIFTLNLLAHGVFGVEPADWRRIADVGALDPATRAVEAARASFASFWSIVFGNSMIGWMVLGAVVSSALLLLVRHPAALLTAALAGGAGIVLTLAQIAVTGLAMPERGFFFLWPALVAPALLLCAAATTGAARGAAAAALVVICVFGAVHWTVAYQRFAPLMAESREMAAAITSRPPGPVLAAGRRIAGARYFLDTTERIGWHIWLEYRLATLTGRDVLVCPMEAARCARRDQRWPGIAPFPKARLAAITALPAWPAPGAVSQADDGVLLLHLPDRSRP